MKRYVALLLALVLAASPAAALAGRGGGRGGSMGARAAPVGSHFHSPVVRPGFPPRTVTVNPVVVNPVISPVFPSRTVVIGGAFFLGWPYYYPPYYPPAYAAPAYADPPVYVEQGDGVLYYCPDYRDYYPNVAECPSPWMQVLPGASGYPN